MANSWDHAIGTVEYKETLKRAGELAADRNYRLNPDIERVQKVVGLMTMNFNSTGRYYCPCKQSHPLNTEKDVTCPCPELESEVAEDGCCGCRLFYK